jgi:hypothetical protein
MTEITEEQALEFVDYIYIKYIEDESLSIRQRDGKQVVKKEPLSDIQRQGVKGICKGLTYEKIADERKVENGAYLRKEMTNKVFPVILQFIQREFGYKGSDIHKKNFRSVIKTYYFEWIKSLKSTNERLTSATLEITPQAESRSKTYLIIKIDQTDNKEGTENFMYRLDAWFLDLKNKYHPLETTILNRTEDNRFDSMEAIKSLFGKLISDCDQLISDCDERTSNDLIIEFFVCNDLLLDDFDCWRYEIFESTTQLNTNYLIHVRSLVRTTSNYQMNGPIMNKWRTRWERLQQARLEEHSTDDYETYFCHPETIWGNLCSSDKESLKPLLSKMLLHGVPVGIWSREYTEVENHRREINELLSGSSCTELSQRIQNRRSYSHRDNDTLKDNLSLLWEDPNRIPPFDKINTGHFAQ